MGRTLSIAVVVNVLLSPEGNPGSVGEPLGHLVGTAVVTGNATGGTVQLSWVVQNPTTNPTLDDQRLQYLFFVDDFRTTVDADPGNADLAIFTHGDRANVALGPPFTHREVSGMSLTAFGVFGNVAPWLQGRTSRLPIFWNPRELADNLGNIAEINFGSNVDGASYRIEIFGRYYDKSVLGNRAYGRLISPVALSQFEG